MPDEGSRTREGTLIIIGGHEDKEGERVILREIARVLRGGKLVLATIASHEPKGYFEAYQRAFGAIGVHDLVELYVEDRAETMDADKLRHLDDAAGVFFTGGDQESHRIGDLHMAPGLGLVAGVIIDQHFAERGRIGRLLGAVAQNPRVLGIGIDEDTAIILRGNCFRVIGRGAVYVADGAGVTHSNIAEAEPDRTLSIYDLRLHVLSCGDQFDLRKRRPTEVPHLVETMTLAEHGA